MINNKICIVRTTYHDRSAMLQLSLEYQSLAEYSNFFETYIFVDPHITNGYVKDYDKIIDAKYNRINWRKNQGKYSWYNSIKYIFDQTKYQYIISIEDDVLISYDYLKLCKQIGIDDQGLSKDDDILYFHIGAWEKPQGNPNKIVRSDASIRSCMITKNKFMKYVKPYYESIPYNNNPGLDTAMQKILDSNHMTAIAPQKNRHGHIGIYGWSATNTHADPEGQKSLFQTPLTHEKLYSILKISCLSGNKLLELNQYKNPNYFWDFDPNIMFTKLEYCL